MIVYCSFSSLMNNIMLEPIRYTWNAEQNKLGVDNFGQVKNPKLQLSSLEDITNTNILFNAEKCNEEISVKFAKIFLVQEKRKIIDSLNDVHNMRVDEVHNFAKQSNDSFIKLIKNKYPILKKNHLERLENTHKLEFDILKKDAIEKLNDIVDWYVSIVNSKRFTNFAEKDKIDFRKVAEKILRETKVENIRTMANKSLDLYNLLEEYHKKLQVKK